jgi:predicted homoserine dehydrogenase-like protein
MSNKLKHTPGPWTVNTKDYANCIGIECLVNGVGHTVVMDQYCYPNFQRHGSEEKLANARLIASAPDLLEALIELNTVIDNYWNGKRTDAQVKLINKAQQKAFVIITKATGGQ